MLFLRTSLCWYEYENQQQGLPLVGPSALSEPGIPISIDLQKNFCVLRIAEEPGPANTAHQRASASLFTKWQPRIFPSTWALTQSGPNPTPNSPAVEVGTDIFIRLKIQAIKSPQEIGGQLHRRLKTLRFLNLTHPWPTH